MFARLPEVIWIYSPGWMSDSDSDFEENDAKAIITKRLSKDIEGG